MEKKLWSLKCGRSDVVLGKSEVKKLRSSRVRFMWGLKFMQSCSKITFVQRFGESSEAAEYLTNSVAEVRAFRL
jgi:hypothetical protein